LALPNGLPFFISASTVSAVFISFGNLSQGDLALLLYCELLALSEYMATCPSVKITTFLFLMSGGTHAVHCTSINGDTLAVFPGI
jgi:hypothetical protein